MFALADGEVNIFEEKIIFSEVAEDVGVARRVLKELVVLDHLKIVIVLVDSIQGNLVGGRHLPTWIVTH